MPHWWSCLVHWSHLNRLRQHDADARQYAYPGSRPKGPCQPETLEPRLLLSSAPTPFAQWRLDSDTATVVDSSANSYDGTNSGAVTTWGVVGEALEFDGVDDKVTVASVPNLTGALTVAYWAKSDQATWNQHSTHVMRNNNFIMHPIVGTEKNRFYVRLGGAWQIAEFDGDSEANFDITDWHHYAGTYDPTSGDVKIYVDGVLKATKATSGGSLDAGSGDVYIGQHATISSRVLDGALDDVQVFDSTLSAAAIDAVMNESTDRDADLEGHWKFDDGTGVTAVDNSSEGRNGTVTGATSTTGPGGQVDTAFQFDGVDDVVEITNAPNLEGSFSVSLWAKSDTATWNEHGTLASKRTQFILFPRQGSKDVWMYVRTDQATWKIAKFTAPTGFDITQWHHYVGTYNSATGNVELYVDGVLEATDDDTAPDSSVGPAASDTGPLAIGMDDHDTLDRHLDGAIANLRLYDATLSLADVTNLYSLESATTGGLLAHLKLDSVTSGSTTDSSGNGYDGNVTGTTSVTGLDGSALQFDGVDDQVSIANVPNLTGPLSVALWAKSDTATWNEHGVLSSRQNNFIIHPIKNSEKNRFYVRINGAWKYAEFDGDNEANFDITDWHHYAGTYDPATGDVKIYVDGVDKTASVTGTGNGSLDAGSGDVYLGHQYPQSGRYLDGALDDFRLYDQTLSAQDVADLAAISTVEWDGGGDETSWDDPLNWSSDAVPNGNHDVVIDVAGTPTITIDSGTQAVRSLDSEEALSVDDATLTVQTTADVAGAVSVTGTSEIAGGSWVVPSGISVVNSLFDGVVITGDVTISDGDLWVENGLTLDGVLTIPDNRDLVLQGQQTVSGTGDLVLDGGALKIVGNSSSGDVQITLGSGIKLRGHGQAYTVNSYWNGTGYGTHTGNESLLLEGAAIGDDATGESLRLTLPLDNQGTLRAEGGGRLSVYKGNTTQVWTQGGTVEVPTNGEIDLGGVWSGDVDSAFDVSGGELWLGGKFATGDLGSWSRSGGDVFLYGELDNTGETLQLDSTTGSWRIITASGPTYGTVVGGTLAATAGAEWLIGTGSSGTGILEGGVTLDSGINFDGGELWVRDGLTLNTAITLIDDEQVTFQGTQTLGGNGTITLQGGSNLRMTGIDADTDMTLTVGADVLIEGEGDVYRHHKHAIYYIGSNGTFNGDATLINQGTIDADQSGTSLKVSATTFRNDGALKASNGGRLEVNPTTYVNAGLTEIGAGSTYRESGVDVSTSTRAFSGDEIRVAVDGLSTVGTGPLTFETSVDNATFYTATGLNQDNAVIAQNLPRNTSVFARASAAQAGGGQVIVYTNGTQTLDQPNTGGPMRINAIRDENGVDISADMGVETGKTVTGSPDVVANDLLAGTDINGTVIPDDFWPDQNTDGGYGFIRYRTFDILSGWSGWKIAHIGDVPDFYGTYTANQIEEFDIEFEEVDENLSPGTSDLGNENPDAAGDVPVPDNLSDDPIRYHDGAVVYQTTDLESDGFGDPFGHRRSWTNRGQFLTSERYGNGFVNSELPSLKRLNGGGTIEVIGSGTDVRAFYRGSGGAYTAAGHLDNRLTESGGEFTFTTTTGERYVFFDFDGALPEKQRGQFKESFDGAGNRTYVAAWTADGDIAEIRRQDTASVDGESWLYTYAGSGNPNEGKITNGQLRRPDGSGGWDVVREADYVYYEAGQDYGNLGDLKLVTVKDSAEAAIDQKYYRYYEYGEVGGYTHGLKYVLHAESFARLDAAVADPFSATDTQVAPYANHYFEYDAQRRATRHDIQGMGDSENGGVGTYTYDYYRRILLGVPGGPPPSDYIADHNYWMTRTTETLPNGNQNVIYSNSAGNIMLKVFKNVQDTVNTGLQGEEWLTYYRYDDDGRLIWKAESPAVTGYDESAGDLLNQVGGNFQYLDDANGVIRTTQYYDTTTATETSAGSVDGYVKSRFIKHGELGTPVKLTEQTYFTRSAGVASVSPRATSTVYRGNGTDPQTTSYDYDWHTGKVQAESIEATLPVIDTTQNGSGVANSTDAVFDVDGRLTWQRDADGFLHYTEYDHRTGAVTKTIADVDTTQTADFTGLPTGWSTPASGGLHLTNTYEVDGLGRVTRATDANGNVDYTVYNDADHEVRIYSGWDSGTNTPTGPTRVIRSDRPGSYVETLTMSATPNLTNGRPDGTEAIGSLESLSRSFKNDAGQIVEDRVYHQLGGLTYSTSANLGTEGTNYYRSAFSLDHHAKQDRMVNANGTITVTLRDGLGRARGVYVGTDDTTTDSEPWTPANAATASNMTLVSRFTYDEDGVGDGDLTRSESFTGPNGNEARVTDNFYDWRNRLVATKSGVGAGTEAASVQRPIVFTTYDNLNQAVTTEVYDGDGVTITDANSDGVPDAPSASLLRAKSTQDFDDLGRVYRSQTFSVDPSNGTVSTDSLDSAFWHDARGQLVKSSEPGGLVTKNAYDGAGRLTATYSGDGGGDTAYADAFNVTGDIVLEQAEFDYDNAGNLLLVTSRQRFHDATGTGELGDPASTTAPKARVSYAASYYDRADRKTADVSVGTNGGSAYARPGAVPTRSDDVLVSSYTYTPAGHLYESTDPTGTVTRFEYDDLGRTLTQIESYIDGTPSDEDDRTTRYTYDGLGNLVTLTADLPAGEADQTTEYVYGVTPGSGSDLASNDLLAAIKYPDRSTGAASTSQQETYTYNALGQVETKTDLNGNVHTYAYDDLGRVTSDAVTTLGTGVDGSVRRIDTAYDSAGRAYLFTSYDTDSGGNIVNQVQREFNGLGQLVAEYQAHGGAVNTSTSPSVQYTYSEMASGANHSRLTGLTYPDGRTLTFNYAAGIDDDVSRLSSITDSATTGTLATYAYLGLGNTIRRTLDEPALELTYLKQGAEPNGDAGDPYNGLDRFGRLADQRWLDTSASTDLARLQYTHNRLGQRTSRNDTVATVNSVAQDELYTYDALHRLSATERGELNAGATAIQAGTGTFSQDWALNALGNWDQLTQDDDGDGTADLTQTRTHNAANEVTAITGGGWTTPAHDSAGNLTTLPVPGDPASGYTAVYDAWNRLVELKDSGTSNTAFTYGYDANHRRVSEATYSSGTLTETRDFYHDAGSVIEETVTPSGGSATIDRQYVWSPEYIDALLLQDRDTDGNGTLDERRYALTDESYSVVALTDDTGTVVERFRYDPYGNRTVLDADFTDDDDGESNSDLTVGFQGLREDASGLHHQRARYWHSDLGRFISRDPAGYPDGMNRYAGYHIFGSTVDPSGLDTPQDDTDLPVRNPFRTSQPGEQFRDRESTWREDLLRYKLLRGAAETWNDFVENNAAGRDITGWFNEELKNNRKTAEFVGNTGPGGTMTTVTSYSTFVELVKPGGRWDYKPQLNKMNKVDEGNIKRRYVTLYETPVRYDAVANIHFGYVGHHANFYDTTLKLGAGIFQDTDRDGDHFEWKDLVTAPFEVAYGDDPFDQRAIQIGIDAARYEKAGGDPSDYIRQRIQEGALHDGSFTFPNRQVGKPWNTPVNGVTGTGRIY